MVPDLNDMIDDLEHALEGLVTLDHYLQRWERWADLGSDDPDDTTSISAMIADVEKEKQSGRWYIVSARGYIDGAREAVADGDATAVWAMLAMGWKMLSEALQIAREGRNPLDQVPNVGRPRNNERNEIMYLAAKEEMERDPGRKLTITQACKRARKNNKVVRRLFKDASTKAMTRAYEKGQA